MESVWVYHTAFHLDLEIESIAMEDRTYSTINDNLA